MLELELPIACVAATDTTADADRHQARDRFLPKHDDGGKAAYIRCQLKHIEEDPILTAITGLIPRQPVPALAVATVGGDTWRLDQRTPRNMTLVVFYRGLHCPICAGYLKDLDRRLAAFAERGVDVVAVSSDSAERARQAVEAWHLEALTLGYGLDLATARRWGLYVSRGRGMTSAGVEEPELFSEPGLFLVRPDGTLYFAAVQTMPFARPRFEDIMQGLDFVLAKDYPARGEVEDLDTPVKAA